MKNFKTDIVKNYAVKFPNTPSLTLSKKIYAENNEHFANVEAVRSFVRNMRGLKGKRARKRVRDKSLFIKPNTFTTNPFKLPKSYGRSKSIFTLPAKCNNILFISDLHI